jgi:hypothetical protein
VAKGRRGRGMGRETGDERLFREGKMGERASAFLFLPPEFSLVVMKRRSLAATVPSYRSTRPCLPQDSMPSISHPFFAK